MNLTSPSQVKAWCIENGFHPNKVLGQNFLIDPQVPYDIAASSQADEGCGVLEIGPGIGPLTAELAQRAGKVVSVELDKSLLPVLAETMAPYPNVEIVPGDVMKLDLEALAAFCLRSGSVFLFKMHPFVRDRGDIPEADRDVLFDLSAEREINDLLFITDLLITDYSSVIYEASTLNIPMLFYAYDKEEYISSTVPSGCNL